MENLLQGPVLDDISVWHWDAKNMLILMLWYILDLEAIEVKAYGKLRMCK